MRGRVELPNSAVELPTSICPNASGAPRRDAYNSAIVTTPPAPPALPDTADLLIVPGELIVPRPIPVPPPPPPPPVVIPATWLLQDGGVVIAFRLLGEVVGSAPPAEGRWPLVPYGSRRGWEILGRQDADGRWPAGWLTVPEKDGFAEVGTIPGFRALLELHWDGELPGMVAARRALFRLLATDDDPTLLGELRPAHDDEDLVIQARHRLREAAAAALAQAGQEHDPRLRGAARRLLDRVAGFLRSPLAVKPWMRVGNQHVLAADADLPSFHFLQMLAYMPQFRSEHTEFMERLFTYLSQPWPRQTPVQQVGAHLVEQPHLVLGDFLATRSDIDGDMPSALAWLETMARLGFLERHDGWVRLLDRMLDDRDRRGVWVPPRSVVMPDRVPDWVWPSMALTDRARTPDVANPSMTGGGAETGMGADSAGHAAMLRGPVSLDVTFRLALIARLTGRTLEYR